MVFFWVFLQFTIIQTKQGLRPAIGRSPFQLTEEIMSLLSDGVNSGRFYNGRGDFQFGELSKSHEFLLKSISKRQRRKFKRHETIPCQLLIVLWENGYLPGKHSPRNGMKIQKLLTFLDDGPYRNKEHLQRGQWLYERIVKEELMPKVLTRKEKFLKGPKGKRIPASYIKQQAGTVLNR